MSTHWDHCVLEVSQNSIDHLTFDYISLYSGFEGNRKIFGLVLSNGIVAMAGALLAQQQGAADINMGKGAIVIGLAAIIVGEAMCPKLVTNFAIRLLCVAGGAIIYWFVFQTVVFLGLPSELLKMLSALVVAAFLGVPHLKKTLLSGKKKGGAKNA